MRKTSKTAAALGLTVALGLGLAGCGGASGPDAAVKAIDAIGTVTLDSQGAIEKAQEKYDSLSEEEKTQVVNYSVLEEAQGALDELLKEKACVETIAAAVEAGWEAGDSSELDLPSVGKVFSKMVKAELKGVSDIDAGDYADEQFSALVGKYVKALKSELKGLAAYPNNAKVYNSAYIDKGLDVRKDCLVSFRDDYGMQLDGLDNDLEMEPLQLVAPGTKVSVETENGDVDITVEAFRISDSATSTARSIGRATKSQKCGFLLCTIKNVSCPPTEDYDTYIFMDDLADVTGSDEVALTTVDGSLRYPGYECGGAGAIGCYSGSDLKTGQTKRIGVPYVIDSKEKTVWVDFTGGGLMAVPVK